MAAYRPRRIEESILRASARFPVVLVTGARQVGKTSVLRHLSQDTRRYVTLDDPTVRALATDEPALFLQRFRPPVLIDEVQYAPGLLPYVKMHVDAEREPGAFWLTGSQQFHLMRGVSESLAGRVAVLRLLGFSRREVDRLPEREPFLPTVRAIDERLTTGGELGLQAVYRRIWRGGFPGVALARHPDVGLFFGSLVETYLQRDVRDLARVGDQRTFLAFLRAAAARTAQLLNLSDLARDADVSPNTAKAWLSVLEASGIVYLLEPYHSNRTKRLVKAPKLYFLDTGLCAHLTQWSSPETLESGAMSGALLETWCVTELLKSWLHSGRGAPFFFYRDKERREIDLVLEQDQRLYPIEIKKTGAPKSGDVAAFEALQRLGSVGEGGVLCFASASLPLAQGASSIPLAAL